MSFGDTVWVLLVETLCLFLFVSGPLAAVLYANRNRSPLAGYLLGAVLGPIGLLIVALAKPLLPSATPPTNHSPAMQALSELKQLADSGLINQDEYTRKKADILARM